jgi:autotransporter-associated beta strand protein
MDKNETNKFEDLEPNGEVKGGAGARVSKIIIDSHSQNLSGAGTLVLAGTNTYAGTTTVRSGGTLQVQGGLTIAGEGLGL